MLVRRSSSFDLLRLRVMALLSVNQPTEPGHSALVFTLFYFIIKFIGVTVVSKII